MAIVINVQGNTNELLGKLYGAGQAVDGLANRVQASSNRFRGMFFQMNFAAQDFMQVFSQGGSNAFGRAMMGAANNLGMLGAQLGIVAMGLSSVASIAINFYSQALEQAAKKARELEEETKALIKTQNELAKDDLKFDQWFRGKHDKNETKGKIGDLKNEMELISLEAKQTEKEIMRIGQAWKEMRIQEGQVDADFRKVRRGNRDVFEAVGERERGPWPFFPQEQDEQLKEVAKLEQELRNMEDKRRRLGEQLRRSEAWLKVAPDKERSGSHADRTPNISAIQQGSTEYIQAVLRQTFDSMDETKKFQVDSVNQLKEIKNEVRKTNQKLSGLGGGGALAVAEF